MAEQIKIYNTGNGWMAKYSDHFIRAMFGTDVLPTGFHQNAPGLVVLRQIRALNPDKIVSIMEGGR